MYRYESCSMFIDSVIMTCAMMWLKSMMSSRV